MDFVYMVETEFLENQSKILIGYEEYCNKFLNIGRLIFNQDNKESKPKKVLETLNINGTILLYGEPGIGKTTIAYKISNDLVNEFGCSVYKLNISDIIQSNMGETTRNINSALMSLKKKSVEIPIILILDEVDRLSVNRENRNEISEMRRAMLEIFDFLDLITYKDTFLIIGITNSLDYLDTAMKRRFLFKEKIVADKIMLRKIILETCRDLFGENKMELDEIKLEVFLKEYYTPDKVKSYFRDLVIKYNMEMDTVRNTVIHKLMKEGLKMSMIIKVVKFNLIDDKLYDSMYVEISNNNYYITPYMNNIIEGKITELKAYEKNDTEYVELFYKSLNKECIKSISDDIHKLYRENNDSMYSEKQIERKNKLKEEFKNISELDEILREYLLNSKEKNIEIIIV